MEDMVALVCEIVRVVASLDPRKNGAFGPGLKLAGISYVREV